MSRCAGPAYAIKRLLQLLPELLAVHSELPGTGPRLPVGQPDVSLPCPTPRASPSQALPKTHIVPPFVRDLQTTAGDHADSTNCSGGPLVVRRAQAQGCVRPQGAVLAGTDNLRLASIRGGRNALEQQYTLPACVRHHA